MNPTEAAAEAVQPFIRGLLESGHDPQAVGEILALILGNMIGQTNSSIREAVMQSIFELIRLGCEATPQTELTYVN